MSCRLLSIFFVNALIVSFCCDQPLLAQKPRFIPPPSKQRTSKASNAGKMDWINAETVKSGDSLVHHSGSRPKEAALRQKASVSELSKTRPANRRHKDRLTQLAQRIEQMETRHRREIRLLSQQIERLQGQLQTRRVQPTRATIVRERSMKSMSGERTPGILHVSKQAGKKRLKQDPARKQKKVPRSSDDQSTEKSIEELLQEGESRRAVKPPELGAGLGAKLSAFNPNISLIGDFFGVTSTAPDGNGRSRIPLGFFNDGDVDTFSFREIELMGTAAIDPYSDALVKLAFNNGGVEIEEAYALFHDYQFRDQLPKWMQNVQTKVGQFRMAFGPMNLVDEHDLPTVDQPLANQRFLGEEGLIRAGVSFSKILPISEQWTSELILQITNGEPLGGEPGSAPFAGIEHPLGLLHYELSRDYQPASDWKSRHEAGCEPRLQDGRRTLTLGSTFAATGNRVETSGENLYSLVEGLNATWQWFDPRPDSYRQYLLQGETFFSQLDQANDGVRFDAGGYFLAQMRFKRQWFVGTRFDITEFPDRDGFQTAVTPYMTYFMTEFNRLRLQYQFLHQEIDGAGRDNAHTVWFQLVFAYGAHPPEPYYLGARF